MSDIDLSATWMMMVVVQERLTDPSAVPHEQSDQHRLFCDERFCVEQGPLIADAD
jgi:hypothetical protein